MRLRELSDELRLPLLVDQDTGDRDRAVRAVLTTDLADPGRFLTGGELVLTGLAWWQGDGDAESFVRVLDQAGVAVLAAGEAAHGLIPDDLVRACRRHGLPLLAVKPDISFTTITEHVRRRLYREHVGSLAAVVERHRRLLTDQGVPDSVLELLRHSLGLDVRVLSPTGRQIAGARPPLRTKTAVALAGRYLAARRACEAAPLRVTIGDRHYALVPVRDSTGRPSTPSMPSTATGHAAELGDWLLVVEADTSNWSPTRLELLDRIADLVADARSAHDHAKAGRRDLAGEVFGLLHSRASLDEIAARLRGTAPGALTQCDTWQRWQFVIARGEWRGTGPIPASALRAFLEEALVQPDDPVRVSPE
ncbi:PucR family transcriptional regulator ligand-binding domain-containing protein, partial [Streptomyces sp. NPDC003034]